MQTRHASYIKKTWLWGRSEQRAGGGGARVRRGQGGGAGWAGGWRGHGPVAGTGCTGLSADADMGCGAAHDGGRHRHALPHLAARAMGSLLAAERAKQVHAPSPLLSTVPPPEAAHVVFPEYHK